MFLEFRVEISMLWLFSLCFFVLSLETKSPCVTQGGFEFIVLHPYFSECWDYKSVTACLAGILCFSPEWLPTLGLCPKSTEAIDFALFWPFDCDLCWNCLLSQYTSGLWVACWLTVWTPHKLFFPKQSPWNIFKEHLFLSLLLWPNFAVNCSTIYFVQKMSLLLSGFFL